MDEMDWRKLVPEHERVCAWVNAFRPTQVLGVVKKLVCPLFFSAGCEVVSVDWRIRQRRFTEPL